MAAAESVCGRFQRPYSDHRTTVSVLIYVMVRPEYKVARSIAVLEIDTSEVCLTDMDHVAVIY